VTHHIVVCPIFCFKMQLRLLFTYYGHITHVWHLAFFVDLHFHLSSLAT